ncbi:MAG: hypothetical protein JF615_00260 [Asticcacaulis sp.]|nr:hypothetical protein [Asticcacaulis sp.]
MDDEQPAAHDKAKAKKPKTAVVVIHGMGEQWPMETLRGFVDAAWTCDSDMVDSHTNHTYSKPDQITGSFELRRITTQPWTGKDGRRVDFFEFYWAHLMQNNSLGAVLSWLVRLLVRSPARVPKRLLVGWIAGLVVLGLAAAVFVLGQLKFVPPGVDADIAKMVAAVVALIGGLFSAVWLRPVAGDAARYLSPSPGNVAVRQTIREAGIDLLTKLHASGDYDRIIVAGHSLGSVVGYDVLNYAWGRLSQDELTAAHRAGSEAMIRLDALETAAAAVIDGTTPDTLPAYREAQRAYFAALAPLRDKAGKPLWLVSDYVTMGCPLSKADVLLGKDEADLKQRKARREAPTSPPWLEKQKPPRFSYPVRDPSRTPHHAAVFAPTVWTNIYYPNILGAIGDFVSGPVAPQLGPGERDVEVPIGGLAFRHLDYWKDPKKGGAAIRALRRALNLRGHDEASLWGDQVTAKVVKAEALPATARPKGG